MRRAQASYHNRLEDGHRAGMLALGLTEDQLAPRIKNEDMGDIILQRDTIYNSNQSFPQPGGQQTGTTPVTEKPAEVTPLPPLPPVPPLAPLPPVPPVQVVTPTTPAPAETTQSKWLLPAAIVGGLALAGLGGGTAYYMTNNEAPAVVRPDRDYKASAYVTKPDADAQPREVEDEQP